MTGNSTFGHVDLRGDHAALGAGVAGIRHGAARVVDRVRHAAAEHVMRAAVSALHLVPALPVLHMIAVASDFSIQA